MDGAGVPVASDGDGLRGMKAALLRQRRLRGRRFCNAYSDRVDEWLSRVFDRALDEAGRADGSGIALLAVGGYGRRDLCPGSDLDLILIHERAGRIGAVADALWYPIWDAGIHVDHSVRTPRETVAVIGADVKSALSLLNGRPVAGDEALAVRVVDEARRRWTAHPRTSLTRLRGSAEERWSQHGELAYLLEPDVKLSRGGLRDLEVLQAAALVAPPAAPLLDDPRLDQAADHLLAVRVALHSVTDRRSDRLLVEDQDAVARRLGFADADELLPVMAAAARRVQWVGEETWSRVAHWLAGPRRGERRRVLAPGIAMLGDELVLDGTIDPSVDSALALHMASASARTGVPIAPSTLVLLERDAASPPEPWPRVTLDAFVDLLGFGRAAVPVMEALDHVGVLGRYVREWQAVRSRPQRNAYHRYTVDRHLLETVAVAADLTRSVHRPDLLLVGALLHDIGKGFPGDHTEAGTRLVADIGRRMGFEPEDVDSLVRLTRDHLLLADAATRRDLSDPATAERVAERVGTTDALDLLAALTQADSVATGPLAWSPWKATLLDELVIRTRAALAGEVRTDPRPGLSASQRSLIADGQVHVVPAGRGLTVVAPDRKGLLAIVAGVLAAHGLGVRAATGLSEDGMAVDVFDLDPSGPAEPRWDRFEADLARALHDPASLDARLAERSASRIPRRPGAARVAPARVLIDNGSTPRATIVEVRCPDGVGVLSRISRALADNGCDIGVVRALTLGHEVVDTFYVTDAGDGAKVTEPSRLLVIEGAVLAELAGCP